MKTRFLPLLSFGLIVTQCAPPQSEKNSSESFFVENMESMVPSISEVDENKTLFESNAETFETSSDYEIEDLNLAFDIACLDPANAPNWEQLNNVSMRSYYFNKKNKGGLKLLGFGGFDISKNQVVCVVEYSQKKIIPCDDDYLTWGFGIRMMMHIKKADKNAKLDSPTKIAASVTFGYASASYSVQTFGVAGPGIADFIEAGDDMTSNTYSRFISLTANFVREIYGEQNNYNITPELILIEPNQYEPDINDSPSSEDNEPT